MLEIARSWDACWWLEAQFGSFGCIDSRTYWLQREKFRRRRWDSANWRSWEGDKFASSWEKDEGFCCLFMVIFEGRRLWGERNGRVLCDGGLVGGWKCWKSCFSQYGVTKQMQWEIETCCFRSYSTIHNVWDEIGKSRKINTGAL